MMQHLMMTDWYLLILKFPHWVHLLALQGSLLNSKPLEEHNSWPTLTRFSPELKTLGYIYLALIMHSNLYPLTNMGFIKLGRAQFLCDLINRAQIDFCSHIFQILGEMASRLVARTCLPFYSLIMKILVQRHSSFQEWNGHASTRSNLYLIFEKQ